MDRYFLVHCWRWWLQPLLRGTLPPPLIQGFPLLLFVDFIVYFIFGFTFVILHSLRNPGLRLFQFDQDTGRWLINDQSISDHFFNDFSSKPMAGFWTSVNSSWTWPKQTRMGELIGSWSTTSSTTTVWPPDTFLLITCGNHQDWRIWSWAMLPGWSLPWSWEECRLRNSCWWLYLSLHHNI